MADADLAELFEALVENEKQNWKEAMENDVPFPSHLPWFAFMKNNKRGEQAAIDVTEMIRAQTRHIPEGRQLVNAWYGVLHTLSMSMQPNAVVMQQTGFVAPMGQQDTDEMTPERPSRNPDRVRVLISSMVEFDSAGFAVRYFTNCFEISGEKRHQEPKELGGGTIITDMKDTDFAINQNALADACSWASRD